MKKKRTVKKRPRRKTTRKKAPARGKVSKNWPCKSRRNPRRVVIGDEALELTYRGGQGKRNSRRPWKHPFETPVAVIGEPDGSIRLVPKDGQRLWEYFDVDV